MTRGPACVFSGTQWPICVTGLSMTVSAAQNSLTEAMTTRVWSNHIIREVECCSPKCFDQRAAGAGEVC